MLSLMFIEPLYHFVRTRLAVLKRKKSLSKKEEPEFAVMNESNVYVSGYVFKYLF